MSKAHRGAVSPQVPLVLVNAFPVDRAQWEGVLTHLAELDTPVGDIIAFDVPGIGTMPIPDEEPSLDLIAEAATIAMREVTGHQAAIWVGCSMGGYIAMAVAQADPTAVAGLVLIGTKASADSAQARDKRFSIAASLDGKPGAPHPHEMAEPLIGTQGESRAQLVTWVADNIAQHSGDGIAWGQRAMAARPDRLAVLAELDVPAAVVRGVNDGIASAQDAEAMATALGAEVETVSDAGHLVAVEEPAVVAGIVDRVARAVNAVRQPQKAKGN